MNASAIYSKSGKGVQEAAGKTSHLSRPDRAVLSAIDGRTTLAEVAQKCGKTYDAAFEKLIQELDKGGFIREVSAGAPGAAPRPASGAAKPAAKAPADPASDLDFTAALSIPRGKAPPPPQAPPRAAPPPPKQTATIPPPPPPPSADEKAKAERIAKQQQEAFVKAREEAEKKAQAERDRVKGEAEAKMRAEAEAKARVQAKEEADRKFAAELEAKAKAEAAKAAAQAKAKAEAEAKKAHEEADRVRREAEEKAERARKEAEEKARREQEELKRKLEEERRAREAAERKAKEEERRLEEERRKLEEERKAREEEKRREEAERAERRKREEEEEARERAERAARRQREEEEEAREKAEREARRKREQEEEKPKPKEKPKEKAPEPAKAAGTVGFSDSLLADLDSFNTREEEEQKAKEEALRKEKEEAAARAREAEERRQKEEAERREKEEKEQRKREEKERKAREEAELREQQEAEKRRLEEEEEKRKKEAEERAKKAKQDEQLEVKATAASTYDAQDRRRREDALKASRRPKAGGAARVEKRGWGKPITITLFLLLLIAVGVAHVMPIDVADYQTAATDALRRPVTIRSANLSLISGLEVKLHGVMIGETPVGEVHAVPELGSLLGPKKHLARIEIDNAKFDQQVVGEALFTKVRAENFSVGRVVVKHLELTGPLTLPKGLELEVNYDAEGAVRSAQLRGPQALHITVLPKGSTAEFDASASTFTLPWAPDISLSAFAAKGSLTQQGLSVQDWSGQVYNGNLSGTATVTWGDNWNVEGVLTARNINAAVFAPALLSDGKGEGSGKFSMRGEPGKLAHRIDGTFTITRGVLGSIDLAKAIQSGGKQAQGRTQFNEMSGQVVYDRGAVALRGVQMGAGQLNAGASADISQNGAISGRIVADVKIAAQTQRATLSLGGTLQEPQIRN